MTGLASGASDQQAAPGFFLLAWGILATVIGWALVTNYRGFLDKFTRSNHAANAWMRRIPPWKWIRQRPDEAARRTRMNRALGIPFAIMGPIVTIAGVVLMLRGHFAMPRGPQLPLPAALMLIGFSVLAMLQYWRPRGLLRVAARQGGRMRGAAIIASVGAVSFGVFSALDYMTLGVGGWLVGGLAGAYMLMAGKPTSAPPQDEN